MRAYVQEVEPSKAIYVGLFQAAHWFGERGYEVVRFEYDDVDRGLLDDDLLNRPDEMVVRINPECLAVSRQSHTRHPSRRGCEFFDSSPNSPR